MLQGYLLFEVWYGISTVGAEANADDMTEVVGYTILSLCPNEHGVRYQDLVRSKRRLDNSD